MHQIWSQRGHDPDKEVEKLFTQSFQVIQDCFDFIFWPFAQKLKKPSDSHDVAIPERKAFLTNSKSLPTCSNMSSQCFRVIRLLNRQKIVPNT